MSVAGVSLRSFDQHQERNACGKNVMSTKKNSSPFIRPYQPRDKDDMVHIFRETAAPELRAQGDPVLFYGSYIWCRPYIMLEPECCFVVDNGEGRAVGYVIGTPNTASFVKKYRELFIPYLEAEGLQPPGQGEPFGWNENLPNALSFIMHSPEHLLHNEEPQLLEDYPAHMHIDILPEYQRRGLGRKLIETFSTAVQQQSAKGLHLLMAQANVEAGNFYARTGWQRYPKVLDGGASGEEGVKDNTKWMVKRL